MDAMNDLLKPTWGAEKWIREGWEKITSDERDLITKRMNTLFGDGLPFELRHDKIIYIHIFSLLAQLEVLAIQIPLRFEQQMSKPEFKIQMRRQLLDEIFHGMIFTKIVYLLCMPYGYPPEYNQDIEELCNFIRAEECPKTGIVLLNLVAEGWIEELFKFLYQQNIAPHVFREILEDEHRHVCEADLYRDIGIPSKDTLKKKLKTLEKTLINSFIMQPKYLMALSQLFGKSKISYLVETLNNKHIKQLKKIKMKPSEHWRIFMQMGNVSKNFNSQNNKFEQELTPLKQMYLTQWDKPGDPTMVGHFDIDVSCLKLSEKIYTSNTLTILNLQAVSKILSENADLRTNMNFNKRMQIESTNVALVVKLPNCNDHIGYVVFKDCHKMTKESLSYKIMQAIDLMTICYKMREQLELTNPNLKPRLLKLCEDYSNDIFPYPIAGCNYVSLSNIGFCGYNQAKSPLRKDEALKFTLLTVDKKPIWNNDTQSFEPKDILPVSVSADHRVIDGNVSVTKEIRSAFKLMFEKMLVDSKTQDDSQRNNSFPFTPSLSAKLDDILSNNLELGYRVLYALQTTWFDYISIDEFMKMSEKVF